MQKSFFGYRRDNGRVGIRNHVLILPLDDLSQPACNAVANNIGGTVAIQHPYGRLQFGADLDLHFRTLIGAGSNPNVAAVIVIGIEEKWTQDVVDGIAKTGKPVILVLNEGRPRLIADIEPLAKAVVNTMLPGNYGGDALANLIAGDANFSGKMPFTYPKEINSLITYDYKPCEHIGKQMEGAYNYDAQVSVQWAFGYGLSYTTFAYSNLKVDKSDFTADDVLTFTVDVKNTGDRVGKESVLLFSSDLVASLTPDTRRLRAFEKVELKPGETKTVTLKLKGSDLAFVGYDGKWILEKGDFRIQTGDQTVNVVCTDTKKWETPNK